MNVLQFDHVDVSDIIINKNNIIWTGSNFYIYREGVYEKIRDEQLGNYVLQMFREYKNNNQLSADQYKSYLRKSKKVFRSEVINYISTLTFDKEGEECFNKTDLLNAKNGMFNIDTQSIIEHSPKYKSSIQLDFNINGSEECPTFLRFLDEVFHGDDDKLDKIRNIQEFMGLCLTREVKYNKCLLLLGKGGTGKSVLLAVINALLGSSNCSNVPLHKFDDPFYLIGIHHKLINTISEIPINAEIDAEFRQVVTGEPIQVSYKFKTPFTITPYCKIIFSVNNLPYIPDKSGAIYRRILPIKFNNIFSNTDKEDINIIPKLLKELPGIFNWALEGYHELKSRRRFLYSRGMEDFLSYYEKKNNPLKQFVDDNYVITENGKIMFSDVFKAYEEWATEEMDTKYKHRRKNLENALREQFNVIVRRSTNGHKYAFGLRLRTLQEKHPGIPTSEELNLDI